MARLTSPINSRQELSLRGEATWLFWLCSGLSGGPHTLAATLYLDTEAHLSALLIRREASLFLSAVFIN